MATSGQERKRGTTEVETLGNEKEEPGACKQEEQKRGKDGKENEEEKKLVFLRLDKACAGKYKEGEKRDWKILAK